LRRFQRSNGDSTILNHHFGFAPAPNTVRYTDTPDMSALPNSAVFRLPTELLFLVAEHLDPWGGKSSDLCSLRLVSRRLNHAALPVLAERCFRQRCVMLRRNSLETLVAISRHPVFGPAVRHLTIRLYHWTRSPERANARRRAREEGREGEEDVEEAGVDSQAYRRLMEDQFSVMDSGLAKTYLEQAPAALPALKTVTVDEQFTPWGVAGLGPHDALQRPASIAFARDALRAIVLAIITSDTSLDHLDLSTGLGHGCAMSAPVQVFSPSVLQLAQSHPVHLGTLSLVYCPTSRLNLYVDRDVSHLLRVVALFPGLEGLSLNLADRGSSFVPLFQRLRVPGLQFLRLAALGCSAGELLSLLRAHKGSLRRVVLSHVDVVTRDREGWRAVLAAIRDEALIQELSMDRWSEDGRQVGYCEPGSEGLVNWGFLQINNSLIPGSPDWTAMINGLVIGDELEEDQDSD
jgi:hypothetical protein